MRHQLLCVLIGAVLSAGANGAATQAPQAERSPDTFSSLVVGTGGFSCGQYIEHKRKPHSQAQMDLVVQWVWGYLGAYNSRGFFDVKVGHAVSQIELPDSPTVLLFLERHCEQYPLSNVFDGTN
jgi:hypothetical protein